MASRFGSIGAAVSSGIAMFVSSGLILNWYYAVRIGLDMKGYWKSVFRQILPMIGVCLLGLWAWNALRFNPSWGTLLLGIVIYALVFGLAVYFLSTNDYERGLVKGFARRFAKRR